MTIHQNIPVLILKTDDGLFLSISHSTIVHNLENAEMTPELLDDLVNFSVDDLWNVHEHYDARNHVHNFLPALIQCLKKLVCYYIYLCVLCIFIQ